MFTKWQNIFNSYLMCRIEMPVEFSDTGWPNDTDLCPHSHSDITGLWQTDAIWVHCDILQLWKYMVGYLSRFTVVCHYITDENTLNIAQLLDRPSEGKLIIIYSLCDVDYIRLFLLFLSLMPPFVIPTRKQSIIENKYDLIIVVAVLYHNYMLRLRCILLCVIC